MLLGKNSSNFQKKIRYKTKDHIREKIGKYKTLYLLRKWEVFLSTSFLLTSWLSFLTVFFFLTFMFWMKKPGKYTPFSLEKACVRGVLALGQRSTGFYNHNYCHQLLLLLRLPLIMPRSWPRLRTNASLWVSLNWERYGKSISSGEWYFRI